MSQPEIKVGETYKNGYGSTVRIIADDRRNSHGFTFVGLLGPADGIVAYSANGNLEGFEYDPKCKLIIHETRNLIVGRAGASFRDGEPSEHQAHLRLAYLGGILQSVELVRPNQEPHNG